MARKIPRIVTAVFALLLASGPTTSFSRLVHEGTFSPIPFARFNREAEQTLLLETVEVDKTESRMKSMIVKVRNITAKPQSGVIWYVLAAPEEPEPWRVHEYASKEVAIELAAHQVLTLELERPGAALDGQYALSVWLHGYHADTRERFHSDSWGSDGLVSVAPPFSFSVDYLESFVEQEGGYKIMVRFSVRNNMEEATNVNFLYSIDRPENEATPEMDRIKRAPSAAPGVSYVVTVRHDQILPQGQYMLTGWLYELVEGNYRLQATSSTPMELKVK